MGTTTLQERLIDQLTPIAELMDVIIDTAYDKCSIRSIGETWPRLRRDAHRARIRGIVVWAQVVDGLVDAAADGRFPEGSRSSRPTSSTTRVAICSVFRAGCSRSGGPRTTTARMRGSSCRRRFAR
jgi:hypothetical protein